MPDRLRFAPSPTGYLHIGNARTALLNALFARRQAGAFVLRLDDTDRERSEDRFATAIQEDIAWLGIPPDEVVRQSERFDRYQAAVETLKAAGLLYPCYETPEELETRRKRRLARKLPPIYDRAGLFDDDATRRRYEEEGRRPHWRFLLPNYESDPREIRPTQVGWTDLCRGEQSVDLGSVSDPVLIRADGSFLYTLPSVVDDIELRISHVVRGDDHVTNTGVQIPIFKALGAEPPRFGHHNLLVRADGEALSKRSGALSLRSLREEGYEPEAVASLAVLTGTSTTITAVPNLRDLAETIDLGAINRAPARFEPGDLDNLNAAILQARSFDEVAERLAALGVGGGEAFWLAIRDNLVRLNDAADWWAIVNGDFEVDLDPADGELFDQAAGLLPAEPWDETTFSAWTKEVGKATGRKGKSLFQPLRLALTGRASGPELRRLMPLFGRRSTLDRLSAHRDRTR
ncbi:glutamate--tRNA ligase [Amorphus orientalis]|uniref:Glutamate--tRNA ligase n=1 Tax=Amorphus orientalis TaxID=649198 RepID=A0AAE3VPW2_9HYPH|nr:glutamate--tRNA ligase [Amorphus orientalis]MDQ0315961.1 glutamyl-tRNA synthetase [Amorphus orientalis]